jgi:excisionase family DNA binding protein
MAAEFLTVTEAARRLGVSPVWIRKLCQAGRVPGAVKAGQTWVIPDLAAIPLPSRAARAARLIQRGRALLRDEEVPDGSPRA